MEQVHIDRLNRLADYLDTLPVEQFNLIEWVTDAQMDPMTEEIVPGCGTVACAVGHACMIEDFKKQGLGQYGEYPFSPTYGALTGWDAVQAFFGVGYFDAWQLFDYSCYGYEDRTPPSEVALRIRQFIAENPIS